MRTAKQPKQHSQALRDAKRQKTTPQVPSEKVFLSYENGRGRKLVLGTSFAVVLIFIIVIAFGGTHARPIAEFFLMVVGTLPGPLKRFLGL